MKNDRYTLNEFTRQFPDDAACLQYLFDQRHPDGGYCQGCGRAGTFYRIEARRCYSCSRCGSQIHPCEGTIFHKSSTSLRNWFFAMFLMMASKNGVSAKELERQLGVTYKTAWRMAHQIRKLMEQNGGRLTGTVEADETYIGGKLGNMHERKRHKTGIKTGGHGKAVVLGAVERGGEVRANVSRSGLVSRNAVILHTVDNIQAGSQVFTDEHSAYDLLTTLGYDHDRISHKKGEYVRATVHTNSIEGFWGQLKRSINGTFHRVSPQHLQAYVDEFAFRYNHRAAVTEAPIFPALVERAGERRE